MQLPYRVCCMMLSLPVLGKTSLFHLMSEHLLWILSSCSLSWQQAAAASGWKLPDQHLPNPVEEEGIENGGICKSKDRCSKIVVALSY